MNWASFSWQTDTKNLTPEQADWLLHQGSLTQKLQQHCPDLNVQILREGWQADEQTWERVVQLYCGQTPWIFAQTLIPKTTLEQVASDLQHWGQKPIGLWLFAQNPVRLNLEWGQSPDGLQLARRSTLLIKELPLTIYELFLPDFHFGLRCNQCANSV